MSDGNGHMPRGWGTAKLADLGKWVGGGTPSKQVTAYWEGGTVPWISPKDMKSPRLRHTQDHITPLAVQETAVRWFPANSIAVVVRSGILSRTLPIALVPFGGTANQDLRVLTPAPGLNPEWVFWFLTAAAEDIRRKCQKHGTTVASIEVPRMQEYTIPVPPRAEQDLIVEALDLTMTRIEAGCGALARARAGLVLYRASCRAAAFDGGFTSKPPKGDATLDELAVVQSGLAKGRPKDGATTEMPYIRTANVQAGWLDLDLVKTLSVTPDQACRHTLQYEDVLILEGGDSDKVGRGWLWENQVEPCLHQNHVFAVRAKRDRLIPTFLAHYINSPQARRYFLGCAKQTTNLASINKRQLKALPVPAMSLEDQAMAVRVLDHQLGAAARYEQDLLAGLVSADGLSRSVLHAALAGHLGRTLGAANGWCRAEELGRSVPASEAKTRRAAFIRE